MEVAYSTGSAVQACERGLESGRGLDGDSMVQMGMVGMRLAPAVRTVVGVDMDGRAEEMLSKPRCMQHLISSRVTVGGVGACRYVRGVQDDGGHGSSACSSRRDRWQPRAGRGGQGVYAALLMSGCLSPWGTSVQGSIVC